MRTKPRIEIRKEREKISGAVRDTKFSNDEDRGRSLRIMMSEKKKRK